MKKETKEEAKDDKKKKTAQESSSSSSDDDLPDQLNKDEIKKVHQLVQNQEKEIKDLKELAKSLKEKLMYQLAENDNTVKRYKKEIDSTREFAISKFAKDLLDVRDNLERGTEHIKKIKIDEANDIEEMKTQLNQIK